MVISSLNHMFWQGLSQDRLSLVLAISCGGDSNRSPYVILWRTSGIYAKSSFNSGLL